ncbi:MAG: hypothetical protein A2Y76_15295 [Planctomycetes bacterium RBG_13_60_9]|nr:MAG: hypothetical protein A2Y76_15295 [Planctomycetes bacterium RBG_13_60_9]
MANLYGALTIENSLFCGNLTSLEGGCVDAQGTALMASSANPVLLPFNLALNNCTFADNRGPRGRAIRCKSRQTASVDTALVTNSILNDGPTEIENLHGSQVVMTFTNLKGGTELVYDPCGAVTWGPGNIDADPCFANPGHWDPNGTADDPNDDFFVVGDYHLKSQTGRWDPNRQSWVKDDVTSPCIDAGDPNSPVGDEPFPNGGRINMGAYGGTAEASKSYFGEPTCETIIAGDINGDCKVDSRDLAILSQHWLAFGDVLVR